MQRVQNAGSHMDYCIQFVAHEKSKIWTSPFTKGGSSPQGLCGLCQYESDMSAGDARRHQQVLAMDLTQSMEATDRSTKALKQQQ